MFSNRRAFSRIQFVAPVQLSFAGSDEQFESKMIDYSPGGIGCKTDKFISPGSEVFVKTLNYACGSFGPECHRLFKAKTRWSLELDKDESRFAIGLQLMCVSHDICQEEHAKIRTVCDLCETTVSITKVCQLNPHESLCPDCYDYYQSLPDGPLKDSIGRYLCRNV